MEKKPLQKVKLSKSVKDYLLEYIHSSYNEGIVKLPPENTVSQSLGVSRVTLRRALGELERDGIVIRIQGRGTFINPEAIKIQANLIPGGEFKKLIQDCGYEVSVKLISVKRKLPDEKSRHILQLEEGEEVYAVEKMYFADEHPAIISVDIFPIKLVGDFEDTDYYENHSVFDLLKERAGIMIERDKIAIESVTYREACTCAESGRLLECDSALLFKGINYDQNNQPVLVDMELYDTHYIWFNVLRVKNLY